MPNYRRFSNKKKAKRGNMEVCFCGTFACVDPQDCSAICSRGCVKGGTSISVSANFSKGPGHFFAPVRLNDPERAGVWHHKDTKTKPPLIFLFTIKTKKKICGIVYERDRKKRNSRFVFFLLMEKEYEGTTGAELPHTRI